MHTKTGMTLIDLAQELLRLEKESYIAEESATRFGAFLMVHAKELAEGVIEKLQQPSFMQYVELVNERDQLREQLREYREVLMWVEKGIAGGTTYADLRIMARAALTKWEKKST